MSECADVVFFRNNDKGGQCRIAYDLGSKGLHRLCHVHNGTISDGRFIIVTDLTQPVHVMDVRPDHYQFIWRLDDHCNGSQRATVRQYGAARMCHVGGYVHDVEIVQWGVWRDVLSMSVELHKNGQFVTYANHAVTSENLCAHVATPQNVLAFVAGEITWEVLYDTSPLVKVKLSLADMLKKCFQI